MPGHAACQIQPVELRLRRSQACTSLDTLLTKAYGDVIKLDPEQVPYVVDPAKTPSIADGIFVVSAGGTEVNSWGNMVFVLEAKLSVLVVERSNELLLRLL